MASIHIFRHGETIWNTEHRAQGSKDSPLTDNGKAQAIHARFHIAQIPFDAAYSSNSGRAMDTLDILLNGMPAQKFTLSELGEMDMGCWEGMTFDEIACQYGEQYKQFRLNPEDYKSVGGESFEDLKLRVNRVIRHLLDKHSGQQVLVVTHGMFLRTLQVIAKKAEISELWNLSPINNLSYFVLSEHNGSFQLEKR
ncbi:histidine phosphatase family protein [Photobacterium gaetbulicola]|uniref:histidine phosphatase family protein n=1 Tax=Photobacterium gaetbulicola TaxID=1295392 RepID=UPI00068BEC98|nr:histidine phosphatase family protein [Photobacterium gaetbulicola]